MPRPSPLLLVLLLAASPQLQAGHEGGDDVKFERGKQLFDKYCSRCHGKKADGEGRMVKRLYRRIGTQLPSNFTLGVYSERPEDYLRKIIVDGGENNAMSKYMPPFGSELSEEDVDDLVYLIKQAPERYAREAHQ